MEKAMTEGKTEHAGLSRLFRDLNQEVDTSGLDISGADLNLAAPRPLTLGERLATWTLNGRLPLLGLIWLGCWLGHFSGKIGVLGGSLIPTLACAWMLAPLTRAHYGFSPARLAAVCLLTPAVSVGCLLVPELLAHHLGGSPQHLEFLAHTLQMELEALLQIGSLLVYALVATLLVLATPKIRARFPWVDVARPNPWVVRLLLASLVLGVAAPTAVFLAGFQLDRSSLDWKLQAGSEYHNRPLKNLPEDAPEHYWRERLAELRALDDAHLGPDPSLQELGEARASYDFDVDFDFDQHPLTSRAEVDAAGSLIFRVLPGHPQVTELELRRMKLHLSRRPTGDGIAMARDLEEKTLPRLASEPSDPGRFEKYLDLIREMHAMIQGGNRMAEADQSAYQLLWGEPHYLTSQDEAGWAWPHDAVTQLKDPKTGKVIGTIKETPRQPKGKYPNYWADIQPRSLKIMGSEFQPSPTRLANLYLRTRLTRQWVALRQAGPESELDARLEARCKEVLEHSIEGRFWNSLLRRNRVTREADLLELAEVLLLLRQGSLTSLKELENQLQLSELSTRYRLDRDGEGLVLVDTLLSLSFQVSGGTNRG